MEADTLGYDGGGRYAGGTTRPRWGMADSPAKGRQGHARTCGKRLVRRLGWTGWTDGWQPIVTRAAELLGHGFSEGFRLGYKGPRVQGWADNLKSARAHGDILQKKLYNEVREERMA